jgi:hypothetical protein
MSASNLDVVDFPLVPVTNITPFLKVKLLMLKVFLKYFKYRLEIKVVPLPKLRREKIAAINFAKIEKKLKINMSSVI